MATETLAEVEARTQELGRGLDARLRAYRPRASERLQDRLLVLLMEDHALRNRLLRFVDVLASLTEDRRGSQTASLFREYFGADFGPLPRALRLALGLGRSPIVPSPLLAWSARRGTRLFASRFIVPPG
ncbi:MAG: hypothetical protein HY688_01685, partial [Chloroflexi bacterium]|nr:hypothetical protein [Chloroflexota bacterium]